MEIYTACTWEVKQDAGILKWGCIHGLGIYRSPPRKQTRAREKGKLIKIEVRIILHSVDDILMQRERNGPCGRIKYEALQLLSVFSKDMLVITNIFQ